MKDPKISVIVPIFNTAEYLQKCICSIQNQSYKNLEIILINDGSADNSLDICNKFAENDKRIIIVDKDNGGISSARNAGLDIASGDYIGFVDSDDYISQDMYRQLIKAGLENNADIVECGYNVVNEEYKTILSVPLKDDIIKDNYECSKLFLIGKNSAYFNWNKLYKKTVFERIKFPKYSCSEDFWVNAKAFYNCKRKKTIKGCYYYYLKHKKSITNAPFNESMLDAIKAGKSISNFYEKRIMELCPFAALYIIEHIIGLFKILKKSSSRKINEYYLNTLTDEFKYYYRQINSGVYENIKYSKRHIALLLFNMNPELYYLFFKIYQKLKNFFINNQMNIVDESTKYNNK